jgi:hypothetical protein
VIAKAKGTDGRMHLQVCGGSTGVTNTYKIARNDLNKAQHAGFSLSETADPNAVGSASMASDMRPMEAGERAAAPSPWPFPW